MLSLVILVFVSVLIIDDLLITHLIGAVGGGADKKMKEVKKKEQSRNRRIEREEKRK